MRCGRRRTRIHLLCRLRSHYYRYGLPLRRDCVGRRRRLNDGPGANPRLRGGRRLLAQALPFPGALRPRACIEVQLLTNRMPIAAIRSIWASKSHGSRSWQSSSRCCPNTLRRGRNVSLACSSRLHAPCLLWKPWPSFTSLRSAADLADTAVGLLLQESCPGASNGRGARLLKAARRRRLRAGDVDKRWHREQEGEGEQRW